MNADEVADGVAIVTGGSRGIGAATAVLLAEMGYDVCLTYRADEAAAATVAERVRATGRNALAVRVDVTSEADIVALFERSADELGQLTALVNNAGIVGPASRVDGLPHERLSTLFSTNITGPFICCREAVRRMSTRSGGAGGNIVNVSSIAARLGSPGE